MRREVPLGKHCTLVAGCWMQNGFPKLLSGVEWIA